MCKLSAAPGRRLRVVALLTLLLGAAAGLSACSVVPSQTGSRSNDADLNLKGLSAESVFEERLGTLLESLAAGEPDEWAGTYRCQDGASTLVTLHLSTSAGFVWRGAGPSWWQNSKGSGRAVVSGGRVALANEQLIKQPSPSGIPDSDLRLPGCIGADLHQVRWGGRRYLVPSDQMINFCEAFNSGRTADLRHYLLKEGDELEDVSGRPALPAEYERFIDRSRILQ